MSSGKTLTWLPMGEPNQKMALARGSLSIAKLHCRGSRDRATSGPNSRAQSQNTEMAAYGRVGSKNGPVSTPALLLGLLVLLLLLLVLLSFYS